MLINADIVGELKLVNGKKNLNKMLLLESHFKMSFQKLGGYVPFQCNRKRPTANTLKLS